MRLRVRQQDGLYAIAAMLLIYRLIDFAQFEGLDEFFDRQPAFSIVVHELWQERIRVAVTLSRLYAACLSASLALTNATPPTVATVTRDRSKKELATFVVRFRFQNFMTTPYLSQLVINNA